MAIGTSFRIRAERSSRAGSGRTLESRTCEYQRICYEDNVVSDLYQITEAGAERAKRDRLVIDVERE